MAIIESSIPSLSSSSPSVAASDDIKDEKSAIEFIEELTKNVDAIQKRVLAEILSENASTEYLKRFNLPQDGATDRDTFKSKVPVITYEDIKPDIQRIVNGDKSSIFTSQPVSEFLYSSGTSGGERKLFPIIHEEVIRILKFLRFLMPLVNLYVPGSDEGKCLHFMLVKADDKTPGGILARSASTSIFANPNYYNGTYDFRQPVYTSPIETIQCTDTFQSMYSQMLCGILMREDVVRMYVVFASGIVHAIRFLQLNWKQLAYDIKVGTINTDLVTDPLVRECLSKILNKPDPELAEFLNKECESENWEKIIPRIWPNTKFIQTIVTGTMAQYIPTLDYYSGGLPLVSLPYAASECFIGLNLKPFCKPSDISYTVMPNMGYFEFILQDNDLTDNIVDDLANLEIGKEYEIIVTTYSGLYRYRLGDILQVTGYHNAAPQFRFVKRKNVVLSIDTDKTSEEELQKAIVNASALLQPYNASVLEYTSYSELKQTPGHYVIYWELLVKDSTSKMTHQQVLNECCLAMEESLNYIYKMKRGDGNIGPLEIRVVKNGTFEELMHKAISKGASIGQYKVPRCVNFIPTLEWLDSKVVSRHFSPAPPRSNPTARQTDV